MRKITRILIVGGALLVAAALALPFLVDVNRFKPQAEAALEQSLGRKVTLAGPIHLRILPSIALKLEDVSIANAAWAGGGNMIEAKSIALGAPLLPLLQKRVEVHSLEIVSPTVRLVKKGDAANWDFSNGKKEATATDGKGSSVSLGVRKLKLKDATLSYRDLAGGAGYTLKGADITLAAPDLSDEASLDCRGTLNDKKLKFSLTLDSPQALQDGKPAKAKADVEYGALDATYRGTVTQGKVPTIKGELASSKLDFNSLLPPQSKEAPSESKPIVWSDAPIDLSFLNSFNAALDVKIGTLILKKMEISPLNTNLTVQNGVMQMRIPNVRAYDGTLSGNLEAAAPGRVRLNASMDNVQAEPLLADWANTEQIRGRMKGNINVNATGHSQRAFISSLSGAGDFRVADGAIKGRNLAAALRQIKAGLKGDFAGGGGEKETDFSELSGTLKITGGIVSNNDLAMKSPFVRLKGQGTVNLPAASIDYHLMPEIVGTSKGQGGKEVAGLTVPILVTGPLNNPAITLDTSNMLAKAIQPGNIEETIKSVKGSGDISKSGKDLLKGFLGR